MAKILNLIRVYGILIQSTQADDLPTNQFKKYSQLVVWSTLH